MNASDNCLEWILNNTWVILVSYLVSMIVLLLIHGAFGFTMMDSGTYLSNALMHMGSGIVLAMGTGIAQKKILNKSFHASGSWIWSLVIGFIIAESLAGIVLWKLEIYRGLINIFNTNIHYPEALIFALAGLVAGTLQFRLLKSFYRKSGYWIVASSLGWGLLILSTYIGLTGFLLGLLLYGAITGIVLYRILEPKPQNENEA